MYKPSRRHPTLITLATAYVEQNDAPEPLVIPEDLTTLSTEELSDLSARADEAFDGLYGDGSEPLSDEDFAALSDLTTGIEALAVESARREEVAAERREQAAALAVRVRGDLSADTDTDGPAEDSADAEDATEEDAPEEDADAEDEDAEDDSVDADGAAELIAASAGKRGSLHINVSGARKRAPRQNRSATTKPAPSMKDVAYATTDGLGLAMNTAIDWSDSGRMLDKRLQAFPAQQYAAAAARGQHIREQHSLMAFKRDIPKDLIVASASDPEAMQIAMDRAVDMSRLPSGSLTAAGWCAPSEPLYDLCYNESRDGLLSIPEVGINRGGILVPTGPTFAELYSQIGFSFTEQDAIDGKWAPGANPGDPNIVGDKPCFEVPCPTWEDYRLRGDGVCIVADLLSYRGYPEMLARVTSGALVAHDHKVSAGRIATMVAGSTSVVMATDTVGTTAPLLAAIELQAEHIRYTQRLARSSVMEGVFPFWIRGAIRQDLSVRLGVDFLSVTDAQVDAWFRQRGIVAQYVYDWQALDTTAPGTFKTWPTTVQFLIYPAGTWLGGVDDIITLDTIYDSTLLGQNKFTALFTEEAWLVAKRCEDSRVVTVPVCSDGSTHAGVLLDCDLGATAAA